MLPSQGFRYLLQRSSTLNASSTTTSRFLSRQRQVIPRNRAYAQRLFSSGSPFTSFNSLSARTWRSPLLRRKPDARWNSSRSAQAAAHPQANQQNLSMYQRFKEMSKKYGWAAFGVYWGLTALDLPFCFLAVQYLGAHRMAEIEQSAKHQFWSIVGKVMPNMAPQKVTVPDTGTPAELESTQAASSAGHDSASIWTQLLFAYGIHKSLIVFRIPLTVAITPKIVKSLRARGWNIGPRQKVTNAAR